MTLWEWNQGFLQIKVWVKKKAALATCSEPVEKEANGVSGVPLNTVSQTELEKPLRWKGKVIIGKL